MNLPNKITIFRVCLIPVFLFFYLSVPLGEAISQAAALGVFAVASLSDALDGHIARRYNLITNFGKLMDPLADKLLVCAALIAMTETGMLPAWVVVIIISREFFISGFRQLALERGLVLAASAWAKVKTIAQMAMILFLLLPASLHSLISGFHIIKWLLVGASVLLSVVSMVEYIAKNKQVLGQK